MTSLQKYIILIAILSTPIYTISEAMNLITNPSFTSLNTVITPVYIKIIKDMLVFLLILIGMIYILKHKYFYKNNLFNIFFLLTLISLFYSLLTQPATIILAGIRWSIYLLLIPFIYNVVSDELNIKISKILKILFIFAFIMQIIEVIFMPKWFGVSSLGISNRNPGFYTGPAAMAFFALLFFFYTYFYEKDSILKKIYLYILVPLSIYLTGSGTGTFVLLILLLIIFIKNTKEKILLFSLSIIPIASIIVFLPNLVGREDLYSISLFERLRIFNEVLDINRLIISDSFGLGTNTAKLLIKNISVMDSIYASMIMNLGLFTFFLYILFIIYHVKKDFFALLFFIIYGCFSISTVFLEVFPANLIFAINLTLLIKKRKLLNKVSNEKKYTN
jgi:hypothetical protein